MNDFVALGFELAFKYRNPVMILADGVIGQMMEKVQLSDHVPRWSDADIERLSGNWALTGKKNGRDRHISTSLELDSYKQEIFNHKLQAKYRLMEANETRHEEIACDDAEYLFVAYGSSARICQKSIQLCREQGIKAGLLRPVTLYPFPKLPVQALARRVKGILTVEMSAGQMIEDVRLAVNGAIPVEHFGRYGGVIPTPDEIVEALKKQIIRA
jgi:2-oxoglutarate ferredoxin oxidoreductase subunit alpha